MESCEGRSDSFGSKLSHDERALKHEHTKMLKNKETLALQGAKNGAGPLSRLSSTYLGITV